MYIYIYIHMYTHTHRHTVFPLYFMFPLIWDDNPSIARLHFCRDVASSATVCNMILPLPSHHRFHFSRKLFHEEF